MGEQSWRTFLGWIIQDTEEKYRLAQALGVDVTTLAKWAKHQTKPLPKHIKKLPELLPTYQRHLQRLISQEFPGLWPELECAMDVPRMVDKMTLWMLSNGERHFKTSTILYHCAHFLATQINPRNRLDFPLHVYKCSPPSPVIRSIYEIYQRVSEQPQASPLQFSGNESLAGQAIQQDTWLTDSRGIAVPLKRLGMVGGCLFVRYLHTTLPQESLELVKNYALRFALAFADTEFYDPSLVQLETLSVQIRQDAILQEFEYRSVNVPLCEPPPEHIHKAEELVLDLHQREARRKEEKDDGRTTPHRIYLSDQYQ